MYACRSEKDKLELIIRNCHLSQLGANSGLHIIIFDELDAICKQRGTGASSTGVHDTVVNQLLSKIDGVEQLNNILVIGQYGQREQLTSLTIIREQRHFLLFKINQNQSLYRV